jgi:integrase
MPELRKDPTVIEWLTIVNVRPNTERNYLLGLQWFTEWTGKEPESLLIEAEKEIDTGIRMRHRSVKKYIPAFRKHLQDKGNAPHTIKGYITGVKSFYNAFDIELPKLSKAGQKAQGLKKHKDIPTKEDIQEVLKVCDPLERAVILVGVSSGLSAKEIINLRVSDFKKGYDPVTEITTLDLRRGKVDFDFITFLSPEASRAVQDYLNFRSRASKINETRRLNQLYKQRVFSDNDFLFIKRKVEPKYVETPDENLRRYDEDAFMKLYRFISDKARKSTPKGDWNLIRSHNMRKYFNSTLLNAGADSFHVEFWMGHTLDDTRAAYFRADVSKLKKLYKKFSPELTIQKEQVVSESPEYQMIKQENDILRAETARHVVERSELQEANSRINSMQAELETEKQKQEAWKAELEKRITDALVANEEKKKQWFGDPLTSEQIEELNKPENQLPEELERSNDRKVEGSDIYKTVEEPEEDTDVVSKVIKKKSQ